MEIKIGTLHLKEGELTERHTEYVGDWREYKQVAQDVRRVTMTAPASQKAPLFSIRPDPNQPRSLLPPDLVGLFTNGLMAPQAIMSEWQKSPNQALTAIIRLADSIAQHGQINPISVRTESLPGVKYLIVTGERRWWAHVLLTAQGRLIIEGDTREPANQIKISIVAKGVSIRAHQLIENVVREDLCAVEKAHGMWALRYELSNKNYGSILPTSAQEKYLVGWDEVEKSLGVSNRYRQYVTSVLRLTPDALRLVGEHGLSESTIRPITQKLHKHPSLQMQALRQLITWQEGDDKHSLTKEVKQLVEELVANIPQAGQTPRPSLLPLDRTKKKTTRVPLERTDQAKTPAVGEASVLVPAPARTSSPAIPIPILAASSATRQPSRLDEQKPLIEEPKALRNRPHRATSSLPTNLRSAITHLMEALDQIISTTRDKHKI